MSTETLDDQYNEILNVYKNEEIKEILTNHTHKKYVETKTEIKNRMSKKFFK